MVEPVTVEAVSGRPAVYVHVLHARWQRVPVTSDQVLRYRARHILQDDEEECIQPAGRGDAVVQLLWGVCAG